jgi:hypothetical protein
MELRTLGRTGVEVPVVGLGTWATLDLPDAEQEVADAVIGAAFEAGTLLADSSPMYGRAERVLGRALAGRRDEAFIATKIWARSVEGRAQLATQLGFFGAESTSSRWHWRHETGLARAERDAGRIRFLGATLFSSGSSTSSHASCTGGSTRSRSSQPARAQAEQTLPLAEELGLASCHAAARQRRFHPRSASGQLAPWG